MFLRKGTLHINQTDADKTSICASAFRGLFLALLSGVFYSAAAVIVKHMKNIHPGQLAMYRFMAIFVISLPDAIRCQHNLLGPREFRVLLALRGIIGATSLYLTFLAIRYLPLGDASVIIFSVPVFVVLLARIFLKEQCGVLQSIAVCMSLVGIVLITRIPLRLSGYPVEYTTENVYGLLAALGSLLFSASRFIILRKMKSVHYAIIMFNFGWIASLLTAVLTALLGDFQFHFCGLQQWLILLLGILSYAGQTSLTLALQSEQAGPVSTVRAASDIVLAFVWQMFLFRDVPDEYSISGAILVGSSVVLVGVRKWVLSRPELTRKYHCLAWLKS